MDIQIFNNFLQKIEYCANIKAQIVFLDRRFFQTHKVSFQYHEVFVVN